MQTDLEKRFPKSFKRILTSLNSVLANLSNTAFKRLIRNHTMHHIYIYIWYIYVIYIYYIYIYIYIYVIYMVSWEGRNTCLWIYMRWIYSLNTLLTSVVLYLLTRATLVSRGRTKHVPVDIYALNLFIEQENTDENRILFVHSPHHKRFGKVQHLVLCALWGHQLFSTR